MYLYIYRVYNGYTNFTYYYNINIMPTLQPLGLIFTKFKQSEVMKTIDVRV